MKEYISAARKMREGSFILAAIANLVLLAYSCFCIMSDSDTVLGMRLLMLGVLLCIPIYLIGRRVIK